MAEFFLMPIASPTMELGMLVSWSLAEGDRFEPQSVVAEIGTDKANMEAEIFDAGVMIKHLIAPGDEVPAGFPIAIVGQDPGEDISELLTEFASHKQALSAEGAATTASQPGSSAPEPASEPSTAPKAEPAAPKAPPPPPRVQPKVRSYQGRELPMVFLDPPGDVSAASVPGRIAASPLAKKAAADLSVNLGRVQGSGPGGRIVLADVQAAAAQGPTPAATRSDQQVLNTPMRKTIAKRLLASHQDIPTFFLTVTYDMAGFVALRAQLKATLPDARISYNDMLIMAVARALRDHPQVNASWGDKAMTQHGRVDVGVAVALDQGLITPVLRSADTLTLSQIGSQVRELVQRAKENKLEQGEYTGGTFTISNLGMMGIDQFTAIINPPESAILAVGRLGQLPVVQDGTLVPGWRMKLTLTCDHRVIDGAVGAQFLETLRRYVETPSLMLV